MPRAWMIAALAALIVVAAGFAGRLLLPHIPGYTDYVEYAAAARLLVQDDVAAHERHRELARHDAPVPVRVQHVARPPRGPPAGSRNRSCGGRSGWG